MFKKLIATLLLAVSLCTAADFRVSLDVIKAKQNLTQAKKWHRIVYASEVLGVVTSMGLDTGSTYYATKHSQLWVPSCNCYRQGAHETNLLFLDNGTQNINWTKLWGIKAAFATAPFVISKTIHHYAPDNISADMAITGLNLGLSGYFTYVSINNLHIADSIQQSNKQYGK